MCQNYVGLTISAYQPSDKFSEIMKSMRPLFRKISLYSRQFLTLNFERLRDSLKGFFFGGRIWHFYRFSLCFNLANQAFLVHKFYSCNNATHPDVLLNLSLKLPYLALWLVWSLSFVAQSLVFHATKVDSATTNLLAVSR